MAERSRCSRCNAVLASDHNDAICSPCTAGRISALNPPVPSVRLWERTAIQAAVESRHIGQLFRAFRKAHNPPIPQATLAEWLHLTQGHLSIIERRRRPETDLERLQRWCDVLHVPDHLRWFQGTPQTTTVRKSRNRFTASGHPDNPFTIEMPAGRAFNGGSVPALRLTAAADRGRVVVRFSPDSVTKLTESPLGRGLLVGSIPDDSGDRLFGLDRRTACTKISRALDGAPLLIPTAYEIDDLTLGVLWATHNLDEALLDDDSELHVRSTQLRAYEAERRSTGPELGAELTPVSRMWLGSDFCARHILRHAEALQDVPAFWTREQRGEESSTWLLFAHKYNYLKQTVNTFRGSDASPTRTFCVPPTTVSDSAPPERILLLLAVALMESLGIQVIVCAEPEYSATQGFALDHRRRAIVADWVSGDAIWHVDVTDSPPLVREFTDASRYAQAHSVIAGSTPAKRVQAFADYLGLDWTWLSRRCAELGSYGTAGLARPRSRLLSTAGMDEACRFVGTLGRDRG